MNIADLKTVAPQSMIVSPGLFVLVAKVHDRKTGTGSYGEWTLQPLELKDNSGSMIAIIWNKPDLTHLTGKEIHLSALNSGKGWAGCMVEDRSYVTKDGSTKTSRQIKASGEFLLEEVNRAQDQAGNSSESLNRRVSLPNWFEYTALIRSAHNLAMEIEPDSTDTEKKTVDRSRSRVALVNTILIRYGNKDFIFEGADPSDMPF